MSFPGCGVNSESGVVLSLVPDELQFWQISAKLLSFEITGPWLFACSTEHSRNSFLLYNTLAIALSSEETMSFSSGFAKVIMCLGRTSGIPPTFVETTNKPHDAASTIPIQNASVRLVFRNISPKMRVSRTCDATILPSNSTRSFPSPPITNLTFLCLLHTLGIAAINKSIPFL
ncbi:hypothetical protein AX774_g3130 [Zancudomyces culisetae]|uniref:Uncharacterized protein n=1 Tax=Zancudomyces culisetae TaxID=1213189 RepID=A0A1R1PQW9_ZANCU|nr:hypothetical protein AX774_g3130 [Zancudomyces culisetae]|eukprot:OMH83370.1 hypothetical protein AX774_g3130 [Zancudomyces culisetae]